MKNKYVFNGDGTVTIFANLHKTLYEILIDEEDFALVDRATKNSWYIKTAKDTYYALFCIRKKGEKDIYVYMHRLIMGLIECKNDKVTKRTGLHLVVDHHPNHYGLDNRRENLRVVTVVENLRNQKRKNKTTI